MDVWVFGNPDLPEDAMPIALIPELRRRFPEQTFTRQDPIEEWELPEELIIIDTIEGIDRVQAFSSVDQFENAPRLTMHDYDLGTTLKWLKKLGKLPKLTIIGIPKGISRDDALAGVSAMLSRD